MRALGFGVIDHGGHGGGGLEFVRLGDPAGEPSLADAVADIREVRSGVSKLRHGVRAEITGGVALGAIVRRDEVARVDGSVGPGESGGRDRLKREGFASFPHEAEGSGALGKGRVDNFEFMFSGVKAETLGFPGGEIAF